jgi:hypothetical protein
MFIFYWIHEFAVYVGGHHKGRTSTPLSTGQREKNMEE